MRIRRIQLYRFRGFDDLQLIFPPKENLTVFIGQNGSGKTSLLDGISMILQDSLYKHHKYDKVEWNNPLNVQNPHLYGSIALGLQGPRRSYEFSQSLSASRTRFISEDKLVLEKNRDLTNEEKMEHYKAQAKMAYDEKLFEKALEDYKKLAQIQEKVLEKNDPDLPITYYLIGTTNFQLNYFEKALSFSEKGLNLYEKANSINENTLYRMYFNVGALYHVLGENNKSIGFLEKSLKIEERIGSSNDSDLSRMYFVTGIVNTSIGKYTIALKYLKKNFDIEKNKPAPIIIHLVETLHSIGLAYRLSGEKSSAIKYFNEALFYKEKNIIPDSLLKLIYTDLKLI